MNAVLEQKPEEFLETTRNFVKHFKGIKLINGGDAVVETAYNMIEQIMDKASHTVKTSCGAGCSFCCHDAIMVSDLEADYIIKKMKESKISPNRGRLKRQSRTKDFKTLKWKDKACSMLGDDGLCTIYEHRPIVCRTHNSIDIVSKCDKRIDPNSSVKEFRILESEAINTAIYLVTGVSSITDIKRLDHYLNGKF